MYKWIYTNETPQVPGWKNDYNGCPPGFREITIQELVQKTNFFCYSPDYVEHRQIIEGEWFEQEGRETMLGITIFWYWDGTGVALHGDYYAEMDIPHCAKEHTGQYLRAFLCGCDHEYDHVSNDGRCLNTYRCKVCGHVKQVDSSD